MIAQGFGTEVERLHGAKSTHSSANAKTQLVDSKLEMVRAGWLFRHVNIGHRFCCLDRGDRVQRGEIDRRLQRRFGPS
jgi:hypothetical protein